MKKYWNFLYSWPFILNLDFLIAWLLHCMTVSTLKHVCPQKALHPSSYLKLFHVRQWKSKERTKVQKDQTWKWTVEREARLFEIPKYFICFIPQHIWVPWLLSGSFTAGLSQPDFHSRTILDFSQPRKFFSFYEFLKKRIIVFLPKFFGGPKFGFFD